MTKHATPSGVPLSTMTVLMLAVFTVSVGYGVVLPLLPYLIERLLGTGGGTAAVSRSTGLLTGLYMLALFLFAPAWGRMSDRYGRRIILLIGLAGFGAIMLIFSFVESLTAVYAERFLSGVFAAAVTPVALAAIGDLAATEEARARRLTFVSLAGISGFLLGPVLGVAIARGASNMRPLPSAAGSLAIPLVATGVLALLVAIAAAVAVPGTKRGDATPQIERRPSDRTGWLVPKLLILAFIVSAGIGVFEVGLALRGKQELGLTPYQIALMFTECSLVMIVVQVMVFSPWVKPETTRWLIAPALSVLAAGLFLVPRASDFTLMLTVVGVVAASAGILSPILTYWVSSKAGHARGAELGKQTAASSLGAAAGSAAGGLLFDVAPLPHASFLLVTVLTVLGVLLSLGLPNQLVGRKRGETIAMTYHYVWLGWSSAFLLPWLALYVTNPRLRSVMWRVSLVTAVFGLTEPIWVPAYWNPPSLLELARRTGFDIESFIFCFAIGGIGAVLYNALTHRYFVPVSAQERRGRMHRFHVTALWVPFVLFVALYFLPWNPIYPAILCLVIGGIATGICRPDLKVRGLVGGAVFLGLYSIFMLGLVWLTPGYIPQVWNLPALSGVLIGGIPLEELLFGFSFGWYWAGVYEHFTWNTSVTNAEKHNPDGGH